MIFHISPSFLWNQARKTGLHRPPSLEKEGFIHCSSRDQVLRSAQRHFAEAEDLVLIAIDELRLGTVPLVWENTSGGQEPFPHIYGPLEVRTAVIATAPLIRDEAGEFIFPEPLEYLP